MNNFEWIDEKKIILFHESVPKLNKGDLETYLSVLKYAIVNWQKTPYEHILEVFFPKKDETVISELSFD